MILRTKFLKALGGSLGYDAWHKEQYGSFSREFVKAMHKPVPTVHKPFPPIGAEKRVPYLKVGQIWQAIRTTNNDNRPQTKGEEFRIIGYVYPDDSTDIPTHLSVVKRKTPDSKWRSFHFRIRLSDLRPSQKRYELRFYPSK